MKKIAGKRELVLLIAVFAVAALMWGGYHLLHRGNPTQVLVTVDGEQYGIYDLSTEQEIPILIQGVETNLLVIQDGKADMVQADCPDKLCVNQKAISQTGETIVCLPNKVVAEVIGDTGEQEFDIIAK